MLGALRAAVSCDLAKTAMTAGRTVHAVFEDDAAMRDALCLLLRSAGFEVDSYQNAETFLAAGGCPPRSAFDRHAVTRIWSGLGADPSAVVITGHGDIPMAVTALKEGVVDFVEKPFDPALLLDSVREASQRAATNWERAG